MRAPKQAAPVGLISSTAGDCINRAQHQFGAAVRQETRREKMSVSARSFSFLSLFFRPSRFNGEFDELGFPSSILRSRDGCLDFRLDSAVVRKTEHRVLRKRSFQ